MQVRKKPQVWAPPGLDQLPKTELSVGDHKSSNYNFLIYSKVTDNSCIKIIHIKYHNSYLILSVRSRQVGRHRSSVQTRHEPNNKT